MWKKGSSFTTATFCDRGTLPRVWEKAFESKSAGLSNRNTPTCVGKRLALKGALHLSWEHSHVCGKKKFIGNILKNKIGTLPRVWEKEYVFTLFVRGFVLICNKIFYKNHTKNALIIQFFLVSPLADIFRHLEKYHFHSLEFLVAELL